MPRSRPDLAVPRQAPPAPCADDPHTAARRSRTQGSSFTDLARNGSDAPAQRSTRLPAHVYIVVHAIDGPGLRGEEAQALLASLASIPQVLPCTTACTACATRTTLHHVHRLHRLRRLHHVHMRMPSL